MELETSLVRCLSKCVLVTVGVIFRDYTSATLYVETGSRFFDIHTHRLGGALLYGIGCGIRRLLFLGWRWVDLGLFGFESKLP